MLAPIEIAEILKKYLADASEGKNFVIQGGDCAETFVDFNAKSIRDKLKILSRRRRTFLEYVKGN